MAINRISFLSIGDLAEELVALGEALNAGKATPGAHRTLKDAASALTALSAEARKYEAALRSAISALTQETNEVRRPTGFTSPAEATPLPSVQLTTVLRAEERTGPRAGR